MGPTNSDSDLRSTSAGDVDAADEPVPAEDWRIPFRYSTVHTQVILELLDRSSASIPWFVGMRVNEATGTGLIVISKDTDRQTGALNAAALIHGVRWGLHQQASALFFEAFGRSAGDPAIERAFIDSLIDFDEEVVHNDALSEALAKAMEQYSTTIVTPGDLVAKYAERDAERATDLEHALGAVSLRSDEVDRARAALDAAVADARAAGASWGQVARAVGISAQAANQRWAPGAKERRRVGSRAKDKAPETD